jgi:hypothetical protein
VVLPLIWRLQWKYLQVSVYVTRTVQSETVKGIYRTNNLQSG